MVVIPRDSFCSGIPAGSLLSACLAIPPSCLSLRTPRFLDAIGDTQLFLAMASTVRNVKLPPGASFFVLGPGRGTTATHETAKPASVGRRKVIHYDQVYFDGKGVGGTPGAQRALLHSVDAFLHKLRASPADGYHVMRNTSSLTSPLVAALRQLIGKEGITGFFDTPWVSFFTELYFAMCPRGVRVILSTRDAEAWAASRTTHHGRRLQDDPASWQGYPAAASNASMPAANRRRLSQVGFLCPFGLDPRELAAGFTDAWPR